YAADSITESTQVLGDGNRITARNEARMMRDSKGRTRREQTLRGFGPASAAREPVTMVTINDPVADVSYFLDTTARTAQPSRPFRIATGVAGRAASPAGDTFNVRVPAAGDATRLPPPPLPDDGVAHTTMVTSTFAPGAPVGVLDFGPPALAQQPF